MGPANHTPSPFCRARPGLGHASSPRAKTDLSRSRLLFTLQDPAFETLVPTPPSAAASLQSHRMHPRPLRHLRRSSRVAPPLAWSWARPAPHLLLPCDPPVSPLVAREQESTRLAATPPRQAAPPSSIVFLGSVSCRRRRCFCFVPPEMLPYLTNTDSPL